MTINVNKHPDYTRYVKRDMAEETYTFVERVFEKDLPLSTLLHADFAMLNQNLAEFYGIEGVMGQHFRPAARLPPPLGNEQAHAHPRRTC